MGILNKRFCRYNENLKKSKAKMLKTSLNNVKYSFLENKTGFIIKKFEGRFSEEFVKDFFEREGYNILRSGNLKVGSNKHRVLVELLFYFFNFDEGKFDEFLCNLKKPGKPDFLVYSDYCFFFVEVKSEGCGVQKNQIQFLEYLSKLGIPNFIFLAHNQTPSLILQSQPQHIQTPSFK